MSLAADALYVFAFYFSWFLNQSLTTASSVMVEETQTSVVGKGILLFK